MKFGEIIWKNYGLIEPLSENTFLVSTPDFQQKVIKILSFPESQSQVFDLLAKGIDFTRAQDLYKEAAHAYGKQLERMQFIPEGSNVLIPEEYELKSSTKATGWQMYLVKQPALPLSDWLRRQLHPLRPEEAQAILEQIKAGLETLLHAGIVHGHLSLENILVDENGRILLDDAGQLAALEKTGGSRKVNLPQEDGISEAADVNAFSKLICALFSDHPSEFDEVTLPALPAGWKETAQACLDPDPEKRPKNIFEVK